MARDNMTRNIRNDLRRFAGTMPRYAKGTAQLFFASGKEYFHTQMPAIGAMLETNQDVIADSIRVLRNPAEAINRQVDRALNSESYKALQSFAKNALDDLKTGNLYDPDRDRSSIGMEIDSMLSDFGGFDMTGFNEEGDWDGEDLDDTDHEVDVKIAEVQEENASRRTAATIDAIEASTKAMTSTANANGQVSLRMSMKQHAQQMNAMQNLITTQGATFELINKGLTAQLDVAREAHNQVMTEMGQMKTLLTEIRDALHPPQDQKPAKPQDDVFGTYGELNIKNYIKQVAKNFDEKFDIRNNISMATGGLDLKTMLDMVSDNPLQLVTDMLIQKIIPESTKTRMANTNKNMESFFPALLNKFANRGKAYAEGDSTKFGDMLMGLFGIETRSRTTIDTNYENPLAAAQFTSKTVRAIEEVIPMWLARIDSHLTGSPLMVYNYQSGKLERARDIISSNEHDARDLVGRMGDTGRMMLDRADAYKFTDPEMKKAFNQYMYRFLQDNAEKQTFINPNLSKDEFMRLMPEPEKGSKEMFYNLIRGITNTAGKDELMQMSRDMMSARQQRHTANEERNKRLQETGQIAAWSFMDSDDVDFISSQTRRGRLAMNAVEIDEALRERKKSSRINTPGATNELLDSILGTLKKGIITYSYNIGTMSPDGDVAKIFDIVTGNAISQREVEATIEQRIRDDNNRRAEMIRLERERLVQEQRNIITDGNDYARQRFVDVNIDESTATDIQGLIQVYQNPKAGSTNNASTERYRQWFGGQVDNLRGNMDEIMSKTGAERALAILRTATETPFQLFEQGLQLTDAFMFKALFGGEIADYVEDRGESSLVNVVTRTMEVHMKDAKDFLRDQIGDPMKKYLLDPDEGLLPRIGKRFNELIEPLKAKILGDRGEDGKRHGGKLREIRDKFTGVKNQETGLYEGGKFSDKINEVFGHAKGEKDTVTSRIMGAVDHILYGNFADSKRKGVGESKYVTDAAGNAHIETEYGGIIGNIRKGFDSFQEFMFGDFWEETDSKKKWANVKGQLNEAFPDMILGGGIGALAGMFLPGGPVVGAVLGTAGGLMKGSSQLNKFLFGEDTDQEEYVTDFNGDIVYDHKTGLPKKHKVKKGGLISQKVQEGFKQYVPATLKGAGVGMIASMFLPGGPILHGVIGSVMGMAGASDKVKDMLFGKVDDPDSGLFSKNVRDKIIATVKEKVPGMAIGGALGGLLGAGVGMIPGLAIAGPVMTMMGSMAGFANSDSINKFLFGDEVEVETQEPDGKGGTKTVRKRQRQGGAFGGIHDTIRDKVITPLAKNFDFVGKSIGKWFHDSIVNPLGEAMAPLKQHMIEAGQSIMKSFQDIGEKISNGFARAINIAIGNVDEDGNPKKGGLKDIWQEKITKPLAKMANKIFDTIGKILGNIISAPFKALAAIVRGEKSDSDDLDAEKNKKPSLLDRILGSTKEERWQKRADKRHARAKKRADKNFKRAQQHGKSFWSRVFGFDKEQEEPADTQAAPTTSAENPAVAAVTLMNDPSKFYEGLGYDMSNEHHKKAVDSWVQATGGKGGVDDYKSWVASNRVARKKAKGSTYSPAAQSIKDAAGSGSAERAETPRETSQRKAEEKSKVKPDKERGKDEDANRKKSTKLGRDKSNNEYLQSIDKTLKKIHSEVKSTGSQTNGVGWNTEYIKILLEKQYGELSPDEQPAEEGTKKSAKKRRTIFGKIKDKAADMFGGAFDWIKDKKDKVTGAIGKVIDIVTHPFKLIGKAAEAAGGALKKLGGGILDFLKFMGDTLGTVVKGAAKGIADVFAGAGSLIKHAAGGIGEALGNVAGMLTGALKDVVLSLTAGARGLFEIAADIAPDIAHTIWGGLKTVVGGIGKGVWKGAKAIGGGVKKGIGWLFSKITGGDKDKDGEPKEKIKTKNIGKFVLDGGYLDTLKDPVNITIGDRVKTVPYPFVEIFKGKAIGNAAKRAIPVYIMGSETVIHVYQDGTSAPAPRSSSDDSDSPFSGGGGGEEEGGGRTITGVGASTTAAAPSAPLLPPAPAPLALPAPTENAAAAQHAANEEEKAERNRRKAKDLRILRMFKRTYKRTDQSAETSSGAADVYDRAIENAQSMEDIEAIHTASDINGALPAVIAGNGASGGGGGEEEGGGLLDSIFSMLGGGGKGGIGSLIGSFLGKKLGGTKLGNFLGGAKSFLSTATKGLPLMALGTAVGMATGTEDRALTGGLKMAAQPIFNLLTDGTKSAGGGAFGMLKTTGGAIADKIRVALGGTAKHTTGAAIDPKTGLAKIGWNQKIANFLHNTGNKLLGVTDDIVANGADDVLRLAAGSADDVAGAAAKTGLLGKAASWIGGHAKTAIGGIKTAAKAVGGKIATGFGNAVAKSAENGGLLSKIVTKIGDLASKALNSKIVQKVIPNIAEKVSNIIAPFKKKLGTALASVTSEGLEQFAKKLGIVITIATAAYDVVSGFNEAANILKIDSSNLTFGMRAAAGISKCLSGLAFGLIPVSWLTELVYKLFASDEDDEKLDQAQADFKAQAAASGMTLDAYNDSQNKTTWQSIKDTASNAATAVKTGVSNAANWVGEKASQAGTAIADGAKAAWNGLKGLFGGGPGLEDPYLGAWGTGVASVTEALKNGASNYIAMMGSIGSGIGSAIMGAMAKNLKGGEKSLPSLFGLIGSGLGNIFSEKSDEVTGQKGSIISTIASGISNGVSNIMAGVSEQETLLGKAKQVGSNLWTGAKTIAGNAWNGVKNFFGWGSGKGLDKDQQWGTGVKAMNQTASKYNKGTNNMALAGCGPTAAAMVASAYGKSGSPTEANAMSYGMGMRASDGGTNPNFYSQYAASKGFGMGDGPVDSKTMTSALMKNQPIVTMGRGGAYGANMHYMVAEGMNGTGGVRMVDPMTGARRTSSMSGLLSNTKNAIYSWGKGRWGRGPQDPMSIGDLQQSYYSERTGDETAEPEPGEKTTTTAITSIGDLRQQEYGNNNGQYRDPNVTYKNNFPFYLQTDERWKNKMYSSVGNSSQTMGSSACGPTSAAMILRSYGAQVDPPGVADWSVQNGHRTSDNGTAWSMFPAIGKLYGLDVSTVSASNLVDTLSRGIPVLASMSKGHFTTGGHYIDLVGTRDGKILVNDPASVTRTDQVWEPSIFANEGRQFWTFTKNGEGSINNLLPLDLSQRTLIGGNSGDVRYTSTSSGGVINSTDYSSMPSGIGLLSALTDYIGNAGAKFDNFMSKLSTWLSGGDPNSVGDVTTTSSGGSTGVSYDYSGSAPVPANLKGNDNVEKIYNHLTSTGYTPYAASGLMGCWQNESGNTPKKVEADFLQSFKDKGWTHEKIFASRDAMDKYVEEFMFPAYDKSYTPYTPNMGNYAEFGLSAGDPKIHDIAKLSEKGYRHDGHWYPGIGLAGWTGGRTKQLTDYADAKGVPWGDLSTQLGFFDFDTTEGSFKGFREKMNKATSPEDGARIALDTYEMYNGWSQTETGQKQLAARAADARNIYNTFGAGPGLWGHGADTTNLEAMNGKIRALTDAITKQKSMGESESTVTEVTNAITDAMQGWGHGPGEDTTESSVVNVIAASLAKMVELLDTIAKNTEPREEPESTNENPRPRTAQANNYGTSAASLDTDDAMDVGAKIMNVLTSK